LADHCLLKTTTGVFEWQEKEVEEEEKSCAAASLLDWGPVVI
jgi:hypothetical protein